MLIELMSGDTKELSTIIFYFEFKENLLETHWV